MRNTMLVQKNQLLQIHVAFEITIPMILYKIMYFKILQII